MRKAKDAYFWKAKADRYLARSVYKLEEIDGKKKLFKKGQRVLDLGCAPGSWSRYACAKVGNSGKVFGIDLQPAQFESENFLFRICDVYDFESRIFEEGPEKFDAVICDMAPKTTGIKSLDSENSKNLCEAALGIAKSHLNASGFFLVKIFQGASFQEYLNTFKREFINFDILKPKAVRTESKEIYLLGLRLKTQGKIV